MQLIRRSDVAGLIGCTTRHVSSLTARGDLPKVEIGGLTRYQLDDVVALIERSTTIASRPAGEQALDDLAAANQKRRAQRPGDLAATKRPQPIRRPAPSGAKVRR